MIVRLQHNLNASARYPGLDVLRAVAAFLVLLFHAAMPYIPEPMDGIAWPIANSHTSEPVAFLFWAIECFIMPLFFVISGVGTRILLSSKGPKGTMINRRDRILKPFVIVGLPVLVAIGYIWNYGHFLQGKITWSQYIHFDAQDYDPNLLGLGPFWYLQYLLLYTVLMCLSCAMRKTSQPGTEGLYRWGGLYQFLSLLAVTFAGGTFLLWRHPEIVLGFQNEFMPVSERAWYFAFYFFSGVSLVSSIEKHPELARNLSRMGLAVSVLMLPLVVFQIRGILRGEAPFAAQLLPLELVLVAISLSIGLVTLALTTERRFSPGIVWFSGAAYWVYMIHVPLVGASHILLDRWNLPVELKFVCVAMMASLISYGSYALLVRNTRIGVMLNGVRGKDLDERAIAPEHALPCQAIEGAAT